MGRAPTYRAEPFRVAVLGLNEITSLTVSHTALLRTTEFLIIFYGLEVAVVVVVAVVVAI